MSGPAPPRRRILVVDDDEDDRFLLRELLEEVDPRAEVVEASTAAEGTQQLLAGGLDLCFLDYMLGATSGLDVLRDVLAQGCATPIIVLTGNGNREVDLAAMELGAADYLLKRHLDPDRVERSVRYSLHQHAARAELESWRRRYDAAVRATGLVLFDLVVASQRLTLGPGVEGLLGADGPACGTFSGWLERVDPEDRALVEEAVAAVGSGGPPMDCEYRVSHADGTRRLVRHLAHPALEADGRVSRVVGFVCDQTASRGLTDQLRHAQRLVTVGRLASGVAHDLNGVFGLVQTCAELLSDELVPGSEAAQDAAEIQRAVRRGAGLTQRLLTFSRPRVAPPTSVDLGRVVRDCQRTLRYLLGAGVDLSLRLPEQGPQVLAAPHQLEQVLVNLATNACDAMGGEGTLEVAVEVEGEDEARLLVRDSGCGMTDEVRARVFEPFFTTKAVSQGTGMGLAVVYGLVRELGGNIEVETGPDAGTTFRVRLPLGPGGELGGGAGARAAD